MSTYKCDVIVLTWNKVDFTRKFITSFLENTAVPCRLIIIDNASSDGTKDYLETLTRTSAGNHRIEIIFNKENLGYVAGANQGIAISQAPYICLANNDLIFTRGWLGEVISIFEKDSRIGVLNPNNGSEVDLEDKKFLDSSADKLKEKYKGVFAEKAFCIGFCMLIRREVIQKVGGLSEEFSPFFFEDTDYSLKTLKAGYLIGVAKGSFVWHKEHASLDALGETNKEKILARNGEIFEREWGKILRILFIANAKKEFEIFLQKSIPLARSGNYVWIMAKNITQQRQEIFKEFNHTEHFNVNFIPVKNTIDILVKILVKKKRYDVIIARNRLLCALLAKTGRRALMEFSEEEITRIKFNFDHYEKKKNKRDDFFALISDNAQKILDVGCADGSWVKRSQKAGLEVVGIEQDGKFHMQASRNLQRVILSDVENLEPPYPEGYFDCIIYADVLEHLKDPYRILDTQKKYLNDDGYVIASIPNIRYYKVILRLILAGVWDYMPSGILDKTHLRFFALLNIKELFENAGYHILEIKRNVVAASGFKLLNFLLFNKLKDFLVYQYYIKARKRKIGDVASCSRRKIYQF